ncbi:MAG: hypothetical protein LBT55_04650 [Clostridiaceae bacterium]|jgi:effector-binding domain-containing protein|nr:hypothetical protein [Clostridiaceae bacterium]
MSTIEFRERKTLKLINVLSRKVPASEFMSQEKQIIMLDNWIKAKGYETQGPLIMYSTGITGVDAEGKPIIDSRIMMQLKNESVRLEIPYRFEKELRVENCLFARFNGDSEKFQFAVNKLTLFAYENDVELTGETYSVLIKQEEKSLLADVFMPVKGIVNKG